MKLMPVIITFLETQHYLLSTVHMGADWEFSQWTLQGKYEQQPQQSWRYCGKQLMLR